MAKYVLCCRCRKPRASSPCASCKREAGRLRRQTDWYQSVAWRALVKQARKLYARCAICGEKHRLTFHHVEPRESGGPDTVENLAPLCGSHHSQYEAHKRAGRDSELVRQVESIKGGRVTYEGVS
jgi:5-methylcytosine-specific restriction endonuclease McrA